MVEQRDMKALRGGSSLLGQMHVCPRWYMTHKPDYQTLVLFYLSYAHRIDTTIPTKKLHFQRIRACYTMT